MKITFSIIIPVKELNEYLKESIPKILAMKDASFEIIILPNTRPKTLPKYAKDKKIMIIPSGKVSPALKRDLGAKHSKGTYLAFIDDDAYPEKNWLDIAKKIFSNKKTDAIGGPAITPKDDSILQKISGMYFLTFFGGANMAFRYKSVKKSFYVDDFPTVNLIIKKKVFFDVGGFDNGFWPGEDTKFCMDLVNKGYKIWYSNKLIVYHHRRKIFNEHLKQITNYGKHRGFFAKRFPDTSFRLTYFIPSIFVMGNIMLAAGSIFSSILLKIWLMLLGIYSALILIDSMTTITQENRRESIKYNLSTQIFLIVYLSMTIFLSHSTYGWNFMKGFFAERFKSTLR